MRFTNEIKKYSQKRMPFYDIAAEYLPKNKSATIIDIGCGYGDFARFYNLQERYNFIGLDDNEKTCATYGWKKYHAPDPLPFADKSVEYVHCSHLIEHLYFEDALELFKEINRVLKDDGIIVVNTPLFWSDFFSEPSHIKPYYPNFFTSYFTDKQGGNADSTGESIAKNYSILKLQYRYRIQKIGEHVGSHFLVLEKIIRAFFALINIMGIKKIEKNGYIIILQKKS